MDCSYPAQHTISFFDSNHFSIVCSILVGEYVLLGVLLEPSGHRYKFVSHCSMLYITGPGSFAKDDASWPVPFRSWGLWKACAGYFAPSQIVKTCDLDPKGTYMFIYHPHGILAFGAWLAVRYLV